MKLLAQVSSMLSKVYHAGHLRQQRVDFKEACAAAGIQACGVEKTRTQHAHLGPSRVNRIPAMLLQADLDLKGASQLAPRVVLERLIVELAKPRTD